MHLIIDGYGDDFRSMQDVELIYKVLDSYPSQIGMTKVSPPQVAKYSGEEEGISGFILLAESHISIHIFPQRRYINIDVFSCKEFDPEQAIHALQQQLHLDKVRSYIINRPQWSLE